MSADELIARLSDPGAYPDRPDRVEVRQTHISVVFLAGAHAYKLNINPLKDLAPIIQLSRQPLVLAVHPSLGINSIAELIAPTIFMVRRKRPLAPQPHCRRPVHWIISPSLKAHHLRLGAPPRRCCCLRGA